MIDGFRHGSGCYTCEDCGKLTRQTKDNVTGSYCVDCEELQMHENSKSDCWEEWDEERRNQWQKEYDEMKKAYDERKRKDGC